MISEIKRGTGESPVSKDCQEEVHRAHFSAENLLKNGLLLEKTANFFKVLGDHTRIRIVFALSMEEMCVCDLSCLLGMTKSAVSHQLATLREAGFVAYRREGKHVTYFLADAHIKHILSDGLAHVAEPEGGI